MEIPRSLGSPNRRESRGDQNLTSYRLARSVRITIPSKGLGIPARSQMRDDQKAADNSDRVFKNGNRQVPSPDSACQSRSELGAAQRSGYGAKSTRNQAADQSLPRGA